MFLASTALAQTAPPANGAAAPPGGILGLLFGPQSSPLIMIALMFIIFYFLIIRPQGQEKKKLEAAIGKLQKGDKVLTTSGIVATVVTIDKTRAVLQIADGCKVEFVRSAIAQVVPPEKG